MRLSQVQLQIGVDPVEVGRARRWAHARLTGCGVTGVDEQLAETVVLLVSELVTNAVVHTRRPAVLTLHLSRRSPDAGSCWPTAGGRLRIEVTDASRTAPCPRRAQGEDTGGRGLELVGGLADRWGWNYEGDGKRIWCEFDGVSGEGWAPVAEARPDYAARQAPQPPQPQTQPQPVPPRPRGPLSLRPTH